MTVKFELFNVFELYYYVLVVDNVAVKPHLQVLAVSTIRKTTKRTLFSVPLTELQSQVSCWIFFCYTATYKGSNIRKSNFFHVMQFFKCFYASWLGAVLFQQIGIAKMGKRLSVYHFIAHFPPPLLPSSLNAWFRLRGAPPFSLVPCAVVLPKHCMAVSIQLLMQINALQFLGSIHMGWSKHRREKQIYISKLYPALKHYYTDCLFRNFTKRPFFQPNSSNFNKKWPYRSRQRVSLSGACSFRLKLRFPAEHTHVCAVCFCVTHLSCHLVLEQKSL